MKTYGRFHLAGMALSPILSPCLNLIPSFTLGGITTRIRHGLIFLVKKQRWLTMFTMWMLCINAIAAFAEPFPTESTVSADTASRSAPVVLFNRTIVVYRAPFAGISPAGRAMRSEQNIEYALDKGGPGTVSVKKERSSNAVSIDGTVALILTEGDIDPLRHATLDELTQSTVGVLSKAIEEDREAHDYRRMLNAAWHALLATVLLAAGAWGIWKLRNALVPGMVSLIEQKTSDARFTMILLLRSRTLSIARWLAQLVCTLLLIVFCYKWLSYVLVLFPYTRPWGEQLNEVVFGIARHIGESIVASLPNLLVVVIIFVIARYVTKAVNHFLEHVHQGRLTLGWLDQDLGKPTRRLIVIGVWLFAIVMSYPYIPGSDSDAFKGVSVLLGVMLTLGGSNIVGQAASGLILLYSRTFRVGEYVRIGDQEGTVRELGTFTTKIRTSLGEELTLPNALVLGSVTKNYSRPVPGQGFILDTVVAVGYETPWRQVEAMLRIAASRTPGISHDPSPWVLQTALSDFYPQYRLVCHSTPAPQPRAETLAQLHANIQDIFNEHGVQILSPHYEVDPKEEKIVPKEQWFSHPAQPEERK